MEHKEKLENILRQQNIKLLELQSKIEILQDEVSRLVICKLSNEKYPYYDLILNYSINPEKQAKIFDLLSLVSERFEGKRLPVRFKETAGIPIDFLFSDKPIKYNDVKKSIMEILLINDEDSELPFLVIKSLKDQGIQVKLCEYLLSQTNEHY